MVAFYFLFYF
jgi:hypothetical protein